MQASSALSSKRADEFHVKAFLHFLEGYSIPDIVVSIAGSKRKAQTLYQAFMDSVNFPPWIARVLQEQPADVLEPRP